MLFCVLGMKKGTSWWADPLNVLGGLLKFRRCSHDLAPPLEGGACDWEVEVLNRVDREQHVEASIWLYALSTCSLIQTLLSDRYQSRIVLHCSTFRLQKENR